MKNCFAALFMCLLFVSPAFCDTATLDVNSLDDPTYLYFNLNVSPTLTSARIYNLQVALYDGLVDADGYVGSDETGVKVEALINGTWTNVGAAGNGFSGFQVSFASGTSGNVPLRLKHNRPKGVLGCGFYFWHENTEFHWNFPIGDSNLDGHFDSSDLVLVSAAGKYNTGQAATWAQGDWNRDGYFDDDDYDFADEYGYYEQ